MEVLLQRLGWHLRVAMGRQRSVKLGSQGTRREMQVLLLKDHAQARGMGAVWRTNRCAAIKRSV